MLHDSGRRREGSRLRECSFPYSPPSCHDPKQNIIFMSLEIKKKKKLKVFKNCLSKVLVKFLPSFSSQVHNGEGGNFA